MVMLCVAFRVVPHPHKLHPGRCHGRVRLSHNEAVDGEDSLQLSRKRSRFVGVRSWPANRWIAAGTSECCRRWTHP